MADEKEIKLSTDYEYGFHDKDVSVFNTGKGLNEEVVRTISKAKKEPEWMLDIRLKAYHSFVEQKNTDGGPDLSHINFDDYKLFLNIPIIFFISNVKWNQ